MDDQRQDVAAATGEARFEGVYLDQLSRIFWLLREKLPRVFAATRFFEERTGLHNQAGTNNLVDALSHIGTLVEHAGGSSRTKRRPSRSPTSRTICAAA